MLRVKTRTESASLSALSVPVVSNARSLGVSLWRSGGGENFVEDHESDFSGNVDPCASASRAGNFAGVQRVHSRRADSAHATAGETDRNRGLRSAVESHSCHNSSWGVDVVACARVSAVPGVSATASSSASAPASLAVVAHACSTPMHVAHNSWSD